MHDEELNLLLDDARRDAAGPAILMSRLVAAEAVELHQSKPTPRRRWKRAGVLIPIGVGALALTGAG
jgi:hypothetical protein